MNSNLARRPYLTMWASAPGFLFSVVAAGRVPAPCG